MSRVRSLIAGLAVAAVAAPTPARACAPVWARDLHVAVASEEALIVWEPERKIEHFVRSATFRSASGAAAGSPPPEFGFLVPVPATPQIAEVDGDLLNQVHAFVETKREQRREHTFGLTSLFLLTAGMRSAAGPDDDDDGVRVLSTARVAGMDAAVLEAASLAALAGWLGRHGFDGRPSIAAWIAPYVAARYKIVAFKYAGGADTATAVATRAIRLSFPTERAFFPYREPDDAVRAPPQRLRLYVVAPWKVDARLDPPPPTGGAGSPPLRATTRFAGPFDGVPLPFTAAALPAPWLTEIVDEAPTRAGAGDLFFDRAADGAAVAPPPLLITSPIQIPIELLLILALIVWAIVRIVRVVRKLRRR